MGDVARLRRQSEEVQAETQVRGLNLAQKEVATDSLAISPRVLCVRIVEERLHRIRPDDVHTTAAT